MGPKSVGKGLPEIKSKSPLKGASAVAGAGTKADGKSQSPHKGATKTSTQLPKIASAEKAPQVGTDPGKDASPVAPPGMSDELMGYLTPIIAMTCVDEYIKSLADLITEAISDEKEAKKMRENGKVKLLYEMYAEEFEIKDGSTTKDIIDEEYCLSYVMPGCVVKLSLLENKAIHEALAEGKLDVFVREDPVGVYQGLEVGSEYHVFIEQEAEQLKRDQEQMATRALEMEGADPRKGSDIVRDDGRAMETCSCIYGNPCVDEYGCKDWDNRYAVAMKNGWKGF